MRPSRSSCSGGASRKSGRLGVRDGVAFRWLADCRPWLVTTATAVILGVGASQALTPLRSRVYPVLDAVSRTAPAPGRAPTEAAQQPLTVASSGQPRDEVVSNFPPLSTGASTGMPLGPQVAASPTQPRDEVAPSSVPAAEEAPKETTLRPQASVSLAQLRDKGLATVTPRASKAAEIVVEIDRWNANQGNNFGQLAHVFWFALLYGASWVVLPPPSTYFEQIHTDGTKGSSFPLLSGITRVPIRVNLSDEVSAYDRRLCKTTAAQTAKRRKGVFHDVWWTTYCPGVSPWQYRSVMQAYVKRIFSRELRVCLGEPLPPSADELLTIHLRGGDIFMQPEDGGAVGMVWMSPPCSMYEKIITGEGFKQVIVITSPDHAHPCLEPMRSFALATGIGLTVQSSTLLEDACTMLQARNLVFAFSSLSESLALLSENVRRIYSRDTFAWLKPGKGCVGWPGVSFKQYSMPICALDCGGHEPYNSTLRDAKAWMRTYPATKIDGPVEHC